jgi:hypothetical protein
MIKNKSGKRNSNVMQDCLTFSREVSIWSGHIVEFSGKIVLCVIMFGGNVVSHHSPSSQKPTSGPNKEADESIPHPYVQFFHDPV